MRRIAEGYVVVTETKLIRVRVGPLLSCAFDALIVGPRFGKWQPNRRVIRSETTVATMGKCMSDTVVTVVSIDVKQKRRGNAVSALVCVRTERSSKSNEFQERYELRHGQSTAC